MFFALALFGFQLYNFEALGSHSKPLFSQFHPSVLSQNNHKANYSETNRFSIIVNEIIKLFGSVWNIILNIQMDLETFIRKLGAKLEYIFAMGCQKFLFGKEQRELDEKSKKSKKKMSGI